MAHGESEISRDEEATVMIQLDILRGIHSDLHHVSEEVNTLLGFQMLANMITNVVVLIMFGFYTIAGALDGKHSWSIAEAFTLYIFVQETSTGHSLWSW